LIEEIVSWQDNRLYFHEMPGAEWIIGVFQDS
jgi:hypothetical protein